MKTDTDADTVTHPEGQGRNPESRPVGVETVPASSSWTKAEPAPLMEAVVAKANMARAYRRVVANKGAPGADGMTVPVGVPKRYWPTLRGDCWPMRITPARSELDPKPKGGTRQLGIPTVRPLSSKRCRA